MILVKGKCSTYFLDNQFCKGYLDPPGGKFRKEALVLQSVDNTKVKIGKSKSNNRAADLIYFRKKTPTYMFYVGENV